MFWCSASMIGPALLLAHQLQPGRDHQIAGAGGGRVRHGHLALVFGLGEVGPAMAGFGSPFASGLDRVEAQGRGPDVHADPLRRIGRIAHQSARCRRARPAHRACSMPSLSSSISEVAARPITTSACGLRLLGQKLGGDDAGRIADPVDVDAGIGGLEGRLVGLELVGLERRVDGEPSRPGRRHCGQDGGERQEAPGAAGAW